MHYKHRNTDATYSVLDALSQPRNKKFRDIALYFFVHAHGTQWDLHSERGGANSWWLHHVSGKIYRIRGRHFGKDVEVIYAGKRVALWKDGSAVGRWFGKIETEYSISQRKKAA